MINSKADYKMYLKADQISLGLKNEKVPFLCSNERHIIWKYQRLLRKLEYYMNCKTSIPDRIHKKYLKHKLFRMQVQTGMKIPPNVFGPGLSIAHLGTIIINAKAKVGVNCRLHALTNIGMDGRADEVAVLGDNVYIAMGTKIVGQITVADGVVIGANSVVTKDVAESNITVAGAPAKKISSNGNSFPADRRGYELANQSVSSFQPAEIKEKKYS